MSEDRSNDAPFNVVCPKCHAAIGGKCLERKQDGSFWVDYVHAERMEEARAKITSDLIES